jgi:hypothetical protein
MKQKKIIIILMILLMGLISIIKVPALSAKEFTPIPFTKSEIQSLESTQTSHQELLNFQAGSLGNEPEIALIVFGVFVVGVAAMLIFKGIL